MFGHASGKSIYICTEFAAKMLKRGALGVVVCSKLALLPSVWADQATASFNSSNGTEACAASRAKNDSPNIFLNISLLLFSVMLLFAWLGKSLDTFENDAKGGTS